MVDTKGIGQPFILKVTADQDLGEWTHESDHVHACEVRRSDSHCSNLGSTTAKDRGHDPGSLSLDNKATKMNRSTTLMTLLESSMLTFVSFTTDRPNRIVRNSGEGNGLEAWRRLHSEYDPTSSMTRVAILQQVQNPPRCQRVQDLGSALEEWLSKKRQYDMFTDRNGRPCQASDDSLVAAMFRLMPKSLEETCHVHQ